MLVYIARPKVRTSPIAHRHTRMKTLKPNFKSLHFQILTGTRLAAAAVLAFSTAHTFADDVNASYITGTEIPVRSSEFTAEGKSVNITLNFAPSPGTKLMLVQNTGSGIIRGRFSNLAQGQTITLNYAGLTYHFVANYYGGNGNDLVLLWTTGDELLSQAARNKLDGQLLLALRKSHGDPPFDKPTSLEPAIPIKDGDRVLVDIDGSVSKALLDQVKLSGGAVPRGLPTGTTLRAMFPLSQLEALASRTDVKFISPAKVSVTARMKPQ